MFVKIECIRSSLFTNLSMVSTYMYATEQPNTRIHRVIYEQTCFTHSLCTRSFSSTSHGRSNALTCTNICVFHGKGSVGRHSCFCSEHQTARVFIKCSTYSHSTTLHLHNEFRLSHYHIYKNETKSLRHIVVFTFDVT